MFNYALFLLTGRGGTTKNPRLAADLFRRAADQGHQLSMGSLGYCLATGTGCSQNLDEAIAYLQAAANWGDPVAQYNYGICHFLGQGIQVNYVEAAKYFELSAEQDFAPGHSNHGFCLAKGTGVEADLEAAVSRFELAAERGLAAGQFNHGFCLLKGIGTRKDETQAAELLRLSSEQGYAPAHVIYSDCLLRSIGVKCKTSTAMAVLARAGPLANHEKYFEIQFLKDFLVNNTFVPPAGFDDQSEGGWSDLRMDFSSRTDFVERDLVHPGTLGKIKKMRHVETGRLMAVRLFSPAFQVTSTEMCKHFFRELSALRDLRHPCVMEMVGFQLPRDRKGCAVAYEFMKNGSLLDVLTRVRSNDFPAFWTPTGIATIVMGLVSGMRFIHSRGAIHRNLKPSNLFITDDGHLRIGDLTWCRFSNGCYELTHQPGSAHYSAPEIYEVVNGDYDQKIDVFSFGSILYEILSLRPVFPPDLRPQNVMRKLVSRQFPKIPDGWALPATQLLKRCWKQDPGKRPSFESIASDLTRVQFQIVTGVDSHQVHAFMAEVEAANSPADAFPFPRALSGAEFEPIDCVFDDPERV
jgi:TPR repeat protein